jgi:hypothetical protein
MQRPILSLYFLAPLRLRLGLFLSHDLSGQELPVLCAVRFLSRPQPERTASRQQHHT